MGWVGVANPKDEATPLHNPLKLELIGTTTRANPIQKTNELLMFQSSS